MGTNGGSGYTCVGGWLGACWVHARGMSVFCAFSFITVRVMNDTDKIAREPKGILKVFRKQGKKEERTLRQRCSPTPFAKRRRRVCMRICSWIWKTRKKNSLCCRTWADYTWSGGGGNEMHIYSLPIPHICNKIQNLRRRSTLVGAQTSAALECSAELLLEASTYLVAHSYSRSWWCCCCVAMYSLIQQLIYNIANALQ